MRISMTVKLDVPDLPLPFVRVVEQYNSRGAAIFVGVQTRTVAIRAWDGYEQELSYTVRALLVMAHAQHDLATSEALANALQTLYQETPLIDEMTLGAHAPFMLLPLNVGSVAEIADEVIKQWSLAHPGVRFVYHDFD